MVFDYLDKVYAGLIAMNMGIRLGAPVEPTIWTYERIKETYGDITDYTKKYINFAADDDANGPYFFFRSLIDKNEGEELSAQDVADAWLNYTREGVGMFWWGGYGVSTEHTAFINLKQGIPAPESGSIKQNGKILAEQIGGQIFIDTWGLAIPNNPSKAAKYGEIAASVSHDGDGINGARFICAAISCAFVEKDIKKVVQRALEEISSESTYYKVSKAVMEFFQKDESEKDWEGCLAMLQRDWGYDKYKGVCHIIPNAGVCVLALLYGHGDLSRTIEIATMCGWDTDCNAGNVGTILGVLNGTKGLANHYREPINDFIALSGLTGSLNILDLPTYAKEVAIWGYKLAGENVPQGLLDSFKTDELYFDFNLSGSTHGFRVSDPYMCQIKHSDTHGVEDSGSLEILVDRLLRGQQCKIFYKPFYGRKDFSDDRYRPVFTPQVYSGQTLSAVLAYDEWVGWEPPLIAPFVHLKNTDKILQGGFINLEKDKVIEINWEIPDSEGDSIDEIGFILEATGVPKAKTTGKLYLDNFRVYGKAHYTIDMTKQKKEMMTVTPFVVNGGAWEIEEGKLQLMCSEPAFAYAGNYYSSNYKYSLNLTPINGDSHLAVVRSKGELWSYLLGFTQKGKVEFLKKDKTLTSLQSKEFNWEENVSYYFEITADHDHISLKIDGKEIFAVVDDSFQYGMYGCGALSLGRTCFSDFEVEEI